MKWEFPNSKFKFQFPKFLNLSTGPAGIFLFGTENSNTKQDQGKNFLNSIVVIQDQPRPFKKNKVNKP